MYDCACVITQGCQLPNSPLHTKNRMCTPRRVFCVRVLCVRVLRVVIMCVACVFWRELGVATSDDTAPDVCRMYGY